MFSFFRTSFFSKKVLSSVLIISVLIPSIFFAIPPKKADALFGIGDITYDPANWIQNALSAIVGGTTAGATVATAGGTIAHNVKVFILDTLATTIARLMVQKITAQTVNWINNGFQGNPAFVTNPDQFFLNIGDQVASRYFIKGGPLENLCGPFRAQVRVALVKTYLAEDDPNQLTCTFNAIGGNLSQFAHSFDQGGGWAGFLQVTQSNQNNPWGSYLEAQQKLSATISTQKQNVEKERQFGSGFLSYKRCPKGKTRGEVANQPTYDNDPYEDQSKRIEIDPEAGVVANASDCTVPMETVTPGSVIEKQLAKQLGSGVEQLNLTNSINQIMNALMVQLVSRIFSSIQGGLRGLGEKQSGDRAPFAQQLQADSPETKQSQSQIVGDTNKSIPSNLGVTVDPNTGGAVSSGTSGSLTPQINESEIRQKAKDEATNIQQDFGTPTTTTCTGVDCPSPAP